MAIIQKIFTRDMRRMVSNSSILVILFGLIILPSLYAWFNIEANMNPFGNTSNIKVAVSNLDKTVPSDQLGTLNIGDKIVDAMKAKPQLGWNFTAENDAIEGVKSGKYYAAIVIPQDFTQKLVNLTDIDNTTPKVQPKFDYYVNEKASAIAPKVTDTGASTLENQINSSIIEAASKAVSTQLTSAATNLHNHALSAGDRATSAIGKATTDLDGVSATIQDTANGIDASQEKIVATSKTLHDLSDGATNLSQTIGTTGTLISTIRNGAGTLNSSIGTAFDGTTTIFAKISGSANTTAGSAAANILQAGGNVDSGLTHAQTVLTETSSLLAQLNALPITPPGLSAIITDLQNDQADAQQVVTHLQGTSTSVQNGATTIAHTANDLNTVVTDTITATNALRTSLNTTTLPTLGSSLDSMSVTATKLSASVGTVSNTANQVQNVLTRLSATLAKLKSTLQSTQNQVQDLGKSLHGVATDIAALQSSSAAQQLTSLLSLNSQDIAQFMQSPANLQTTTVFPISNYGAAVAPLYTNLAIWVGAFMVAMLLKVEVDRKGIGSIKPYQAYLGRWMLFACISIIQAIVISCGDLALGLNVAHPLLLIISAIVAALVYCSIIFSLVVSFQHVGKIMAIVLVIMQVPGAGGLYPIEMMPEFFQRLNPLLPFTYGITAMREAIIGMYSHVYENNLFILTLFAGVAFILGLGLRKYLGNLNILFDKKLLDADLLATEHGDIPTVRRIKLADIVDVMMSQKSYQTHAYQSAARFEHLYPKLQRAGFFIAIFVPLIPLMMLVGSQEKIVLLSWWLVTLLLSFLYIILIEYLHDAVQRHIDISHMSHSDLNALLRAETTGMSGATTTITHDSATVPDTYDLHQKDYQ